MKNGDYILIIPPDDYPGKRYRGRYAYEHRVQWWRETGKNPDDFPNQHIHHKNENKHDNSPENLSSIELVEHARLHAKRAEPRQFICENCGIIFFKKLRPSGNKKFCSKECIIYSGSTTKAKAEKWMYIKEYVEKGMSDYTISKITGIPRPTVQRIRKQSA